jgi:hypothetical protein
MMLEFSGVWIGGWRCDGCDKSGVEKGEMGINLQHSGLQRALKCLLENNDVNGRIILKCILGKCLDTKWM